MVTLRLYTSGIGLSSEAKNDIMKANSGGFSFPNWPYRLTVRTPGSHPGNRGSIPRGVTFSDQLYWRHTRHIRIA